MNRNTFFLAPILLFIFCSCDVTEHEVVGEYTVHGLKNHFDILRVLPNGTYRRTLYQQKGNRLIYQNSSTWKYSDSNLILRNFLINEDENLDFQAYALGEMTCILPLSKRFTQIIIYYQLDGSDTFYYRKL